ncbi:MAG: hypothetical protein PHP65_01790 [Bacilli bacterium]|nr:hypothetical protein [Bacilli bacterium]
MINTEDYRGYIKQNENIIRLFKTNESLVYDRLMDVFTVLEYVDKLVAEKSKVDEELEVIFDAGFSFFHEQWETIQLIYERYFHQDIIAFSHYASLINYLLYIDDLEETLKEKELLTQERKAVLSTIFEEIEQKLISKLPYDVALFDDYDWRIQMLALDGINTTIEIFAMIVEELQL